MIWLVAILALSILIIIHEFGHYICARAVGMHVDRFSVIGIGPVVLRLFEYQGCEFVISAIPFGAYVHIVGMEAEDKEDASNNVNSSLASSASLEPNPSDGNQSEDSSSKTPAELGYARFRDRPVWARFLAIIGGPAANYLAAMAIMIGVFATVGMQQTVATTIAGFSSESPAQAAGLEVGDVYVSIAGQSVQGKDAPSRVIQVTTQHLGETVDITVERSYGQITIPVTLNTQAPALGTTMQALGDFQDVPLTTALFEGIRWPLKETKRQLGGLWRMITGESQGKIGGPVAIVRMIHNSAENGFVELLGFTALISTVLGMFNLLPLPALDGGRLVFLIYEMIARRPTNRKMEEWVHTVGMIGLLGLFVYVTIGDIKGEDKEPIWKRAVDRFERDIDELTSKSTTESDHPVEKTDSIDQPSVGIDHEKER